MELSGQNITIIVVALVFAALVCYALYKGKTPRVTTKIAGTEVGFELGGEKAPAPDAKTAPAVGDIRDNRLLENAKLSGRQQIHLGHNVGAPHPPARKGEKDS